MKPKILISVFFILGAIELSAQNNRWGMDALLGFTTANVNRIKPTPGFDGYFVRKLTPRLSLGGTVGIQNYSLYKKGNTITYQGIYMGEILNVTQENSYLFFSPKIDFGIGRYQLIHAYFSCGPGMCTKGNQSIEYVNSMTSAGGAYGPTTGRMDIPANYNIFIFRANIGFTEYVGTNRHKNIFFFQQFSMIPSSIGRYSDYEIANRTGNQHYLRSNYAAIGIGFINKNAIQKPINPKKKHQTFAESFDY